MFLDKLSNVSVEKLRYHPIVVAAQKATQFQPLIGIETLEI